MWKQRPRSYWLVSYWQTCTLSLHLSSHMGHCVHTWQPPLSHVHVSWGADSECGGHEPSLRSWVVLGSCLSAVKQLYTFSQEQHQFCHPEAGIALVLYTSWNFWTFPLSFTVSVSYLAIAIYYLIKHIAKKVFFIIFNYWKSCFLRQQHFGTYPTNLAPPKISSHEELGLVSPHTIPL